MNKANTYVYIANKNTYSILKPILFCVQNIYYMKHINNQMIYLMESLALRTLCLLSLTCLNLCYRKLTEKKQQNTYTHTHKPTLRDSIQIQSTYIG